LHGNASVIVWFRIAAFFSDEIFSDTMRMPRATRYMFDQSLASGAQSSAIAIFP
jgi:hypothetical protein